MFRNLTPHPLVLLPEGGEPIVLAPDPAGPARVSTTSVPVIGAPEAPVPVVMTAWGAISGVPPYEPGTILIVSRIVREAIVAQRATRPDVMVPHDLVRDAEGRVIGARALSY